MRIWIGLLCGVCLGGPAWTQEVTEDLLAEARELVGAGRHAEAIPLYETLMAEAEAREGGASWSLVFLAYELAVQHHTLGRAADAEALYRRSLAIVEQRRGEEDPALVPSLRGLAALAAMRGELADAESLYRRALELQEADADSRPGIARTLAELGLLCQLQERPADAAELYRRALETGEANDLKGNEVATIAGNLAALYSRQGRTAEAESYYRQALEVREGFLGPGHPDLVKTLQELASLEIRRHRFAEAASLLERILRIREQTEPEGLALSDVMSRLAATYRQLGRSAEAEVHFGMARSILNAQCGGREETARCSDAIRVHQQLLRLEPVDPAAPWGEPPPQPDAERIATVVPPAPLPPPSPALVSPPPSPPPPSKPAAAPAPRVHRAQVAARRDRREAAEVLEQLRDAHPDLLGDLAARVVSADLGERGVWHRVQIGEFSNAARAKVLCAELAKRGHEGCWVIVTGG